MATRRNAIRGLAILSGGLITIPRTIQSKNRADGNGQFSYCLNTSTISGQKTGFLNEFRIAALAGYDGIEIWVRDLQEYLKQGGTTQEVRNHASDLGIVIENAIGFAPWAVDDEAIRAAGMEQMKKEMELLAEVGCLRIAAPPAGASSPPLLDLEKVASRYGDLLELGRQMGVLPQLEFWGASANLFKMEQAMYVAAASGHPDACILPDVYHMFRGGSSYHSLKLLSNSALQMIHFNDFVDTIPRPEQNDEDRVYPGDGAAPFQEIVNYLKLHGGKKVLSLELFNKDYWQEDALEVAKKGLQKMKQVVNLSD